MTITKKVLITALSLATFGGTAAAFSMPVADAFQGGDKRGGSNSNHSEKRSDMEINENITRTVEKTDNGIIETLTTDNSDTLEKLQSKEVREPYNGDMTVTKENSENGVVITKATQDSELLSRMHERADMGELRKSITHSVENTENGVDISITSDNEKAIEHIQNKEEKLGDNKHKDVEFSKEDIQNGARITISSSNPDTVEKIQERAENPEKGEVLEKRGHEKMDKEFDKPERE